MLLKLLYIGFPALAYLLGALTFFNHGAHPVNTYQLFEERGEELVAFVHAAVSLDKIAEVELLSNDFVVAHA